MRARHAPFSSSAQLPVLLNASRQVVDRVPAADCLMCDWESVLRQKSTAASPNEVLVVTLDQFCRHVGSHMEQLALFALPRSYKDHGSEGDSNEAAAAVGSNASSHGSIGQGALSWRSISSVAATQDQAVPDLTVDENQKPLEVTHYPGTSKPSPDAWSSSYLSHINGYRLSSFQCIGGATGQRCLRQGKIYIHGGKLDGSNVEEDTYAIDMSEGKATICVPGITTPQAPGPCVYAAAVSSRFLNAFIVFGGDTSLGIIDRWDTALYWLDIRMILGFQ